MDSTVSGPALNLLKTLSGVGSLESVSSLVELLLGEGNVYELSGTASLEIATPSVALQLLKVLSGMVSLDNEVPIINLNILRTLSGIAIGETAVSSVALWPLIKRGDRIVITLGR